MTAPAIPSAGADGAQAAELRAALQRVLQAMPYPHWLDIRVDGDADGPIFTLPARADLIGNPRLPALHGGSVAALMEAAALATVLVGEAQSRLPKPIDFSLDYLRSARVEALHAACQVLRQGRQVVAVRIDCWQQDRQQLTATGRAHLLLGDAPAAGPEGDAAAAADAP